MSALDLHNYQSIEVALFCKIVLPAPAEPILMSDYYQPIFIAGDNYTALGQFLSITDTSSDLKMTNSELTIVMSGIPNSTLSDFMTLGVKGSPITVIRAVFDPHTHNLLPVAGNPAGKFKGIINTIAINEELNGKNQTSSISLICKSQVGMVASRVSGRQTNPASENSFYPNDRSMDRVPSLPNAKINFGGV